VLRIRPDGTAHHYAEPAPLLSRIVVPIDGSPTSLSILPAAAALSITQKGTVVLLRVVQSVLPFSAFAGNGFPEVGLPALYPSPADAAEATAFIREEALRELSEAAVTLREAGAPSVETHVVAADDTATAIVNFAEAEKASLVAMSTHGRGGSRLLVGSVADKVLAHSTLPMLIQRPVPTHIPDVPSLRPAILQSTPLYVN
jgi:nucleotide-binding universal stress UspA family protein